MRKWTLSIVLGVVIGLSGSFCLHGCTKEIDDQGKTTWKLDPIRAEQIEDTIEGGANLLKVIYPPAGAAMVTLLGLLGYWRKKIKPSFEKAKIEANLYHTTTHTIVAAIEELKKTDNPAWKKLEKELGPMSVNLENVIRAIRGLPKIE